MQLNFQELSPRDRYKLLASVVVPRPIALVTSQDANGIVNAAPFSFFNAMGSDPPMVVLGIANRPDTGERKDTVRNIRATRQFVINLVDDALAERMNICAIDFPAAVSEIDEAGLTTIPSVAVAPPRIAESPVNLECRELATVEIGNNRVVMGEVLHLHIRDELFDAERLHVHTNAMHLVGRMHGAGWYTRTHDLFKMDRMTLPQWRTMNKD